MSEEKAGGRQGMVISLLIYLRARAHSKFSYGSFAKTCSLTPLSPPQELELSVVLPCSL